MAPAVLAEHWIEFFRIEIEQVDVVPGALQAGERLDADRGMKTFGQRVAINIEHFHARTGT